MSGEQKQRVPRALWNLSKTDGYIAQVHCEGEVYIEKTTL